jgi:signal transduction histidine kinase
MVTLETSKLFSQVPAAEWPALRQAARELRFAAGQQIFKEGDPGDGTYVVKTGLVQISAVLENGERHVFSEVLPGDVFGEMAVLDHQPRSACASAEQETTAYFLPRDELLKLLKRSPELSLTMVQEISGRLREFNRQYLRKVLHAERLAMVGRFASSIVHDLKNPLTIIHLNADFICSGEVNEEARRSARERINKQIDQITTMVNDVLDFTRSEPAKLVLGKFDYAQFVRELVEEYRKDLALKRVDIDFENDPPAVKVPLNPARLSRVFYNLFGNASDALPEGGRVKIRFELTEREVITEIEDGGPGIAPEVLNHVFEAFVTHGKVKGTGLGLSISRRIIEEHGGTITARNQVGGGAVFAFALPRQQRVP